MPIYDVRSENESRRSLLVMDRDSETAYSGRHVVVFIESAALMGGVEFSTLYLAQNLDRSRWLPMVVCPEEGDLPEACRRAGVLVRILRRPALYSTGIRLGNAWQVPNPLAWCWDAGAVFLAGWRLARLLAHMRPDLVVTKGMFSHFYGGLAAQRLGIPCIWHVQDFVSERFWGVYRQVFGQVARRLPDHIIVDGEPIARQMPRGVQERVSLIYNGVDTRVFRPGLDGIGVRRELGIPSNALVIGHVARMTPWKGQHQLLEAFAKFAAEVPHACLLFVGAPVFDNKTYEERLRNRTLDLGLRGRVIFSGYRHDLPHVLAAMDLFAFTSMKKDTSPLALLSAMAAGLPIVAYDIDGVREVVRDGQEGLLVPVGHKGLLAEALTRIYDDNELRHELAKAARRRVEAAFNLEGHVSRMEEVFLKMIHDLRSEN